jgi:hypothetical protein
MFRVWCDDCADYCNGTGRARNLSWWLAKVGAERAAERHQAQHAAKPRGARMFGMVGENVPPNSGEYKEVSAITTRAKVEST